MKLALRIAVLFSLLVPGLVFAADGTEKGARALLEAFLKPGADHAALSKGLRPTSADFKSIFEGDAAASAEKTYAEPWDKGQMVVKPNPGQTELLLFSATTDELKAGAPKAKEFPGGYAKVAGLFKKGLTLYRFKFVEKGKDIGMAYDGLTFVNGHWVIVPKPWKAVK